MKEVRVGGSGVLRDSHLLGFFGICGCRWL